MQVEKSQENYLDKCQHSTCVYNSSDRIMLLFSDYNDRKFFVLNIFNRLENKIYPQYYSERYSIVHMYNVTSYIIQVNPTFHVVLHPPFFSVQILREKYVEAYYVTL